LRVSRAQPETEQAWAPGPLRPLLAEHAVHVWRADLTDVPDALGELLDDGERARAARVGKARDAERWRRSHGLLRALLGGYLQLEPASLRFTAGEHGKPALAADSDRGRAGAPHEPDPTRIGSRLSFNMSHSAQLALYAFSRAGAVGVDVEVGRRPIDEVAVAARALGMATANRLRTLEQPARSREFLAAWARHEAQLKCLGVGIGGAGFGGSAGAGEDHGLWLVELEMGPDVAAAVAAEHPARELCCWDWRA
jgi:4'-phosphopantetheinyl transferase